MKFNHLLNSIQTTHVHFQEVAAKAINRSLTIRNWMIGCYIVEYEQNGVDRAKYGAKLLELISKELPNLKLSTTNLRLCRQFYQYYPQLSAVVSDELKNNTIQIHQSLTDEFEKINMRIHQSMTDELQITNNQLDIISQPPTAKLKSTRNTTASSAMGQLRIDRVPGKKIVNNLSFTHIASLLAINDTLRRTFYEVECIKGNWSVRELKRQIDTGYFERMGFTNNPQKLSRLVQQSAESPITPADLIKNLYAFEFLDLPQKAIVKESKVEQKLLDHLEAFLLEMGHGFCLEGRRKRILIGQEYYFVDVVFYHRILKCHVLIELKVGKFSYADTGQLTTYLNYFKAEMMEPGDNPPIGILLVTERDNDGALAKYAIPAGMDQQMFISTYAVQLPTVEELQQCLAEELRRCES
ncbi:PDDEXK nuclease domain-containing protein [Chitinophaga sp.]|uniref:PDDEXK nuclease domain-containing protein n=1 Tax=Chitinophaga sp. TaxID=1869181 RepID=UPI002F9551B5